MSNSLAEGTAPDELSSVGLLSLLASLLYFPVIIVAFAHLRLLKFLSHIFPNIPDFKVEIDQKEIERLSAMSGFTHSQVRHLWKRFDSLSGTRNHINASDLAGIPELAMNPLSQRIVSVLMRDSNGKPRPNQSRKYLSTMTRQRRNSAMKMLTSGNSDQGTIDFEQFVQRLSVFSLSDDRRDEKLAFAFRVFDAKDDGVIDSEELTYVLKLMTGDKLESRLLRQIVDDTIISVDTDRDGKISISEFKKGFDGVDVAAHLGLQF